LETIREYARVQLRADGAESAVRAQHAQYFATLSERAERGMDGKEQALWLDRLESEHDNLRAAVAWADDSGDTTLALKLAACLWPFWAVHGHISEGRTLLERALDRQADGDRGLRARALHGVFTLARIQGERARLRPLAEEQLDISRAQDEPHAIGRAFTDLGVVAQNEGDPGRAIALYEQSAEHFRRADYKPGLAAAVACRAYLSLGQGDWANAFSLFEESLDHYRDLGHGRGVAQTLSNLGTAALHLERYDEASSFLGESLRYCQQLGYTECIATSLIALAATSAAQGRPRRAVQLAAGAQALCELIGATLEPVERQELAETIETGRALLGQGRFAQAWQAGALMNSDQLVSLALKRDPATTPCSGHSESAMSRT